jgi:hypothetical protein
MSTPDHEQADSVYLPILKDFLEERRVPLTVEDSDPVDNLAETLLETA